MARPLRIQYPGAFYHVTCRGNERRRIFLDDEDRYRFLQILSGSLETYQVVLYAYVMMGNHFHLVVQTMRANLSEFMRRFNICYTGWFNYHHGTCGHLYQGRYKALVVDADNYLLGLSRYIHLNPVRIGQYQKSDYPERWQHLQRYQWSSLSGYLNEKREAKYINYAMVLEMAGGRGDYKSFMLAGLKERLADPFDDVQYQVILGDENFVARVKSEYVETGSLREQPTYRAMKVAIIEPEKVLVCVAKCLRIDPCRLSARLGNGVERGIVAELLYRYSNITQREIGKILGGIDYTAVSMLRRRLQVKMVAEPTVKNKYIKAERCLRLLCEE